MQSDVTKHRSVVLFVNDVVSELHPRVYSFQGCKQRPQLASFEFEVCRVVFTADRNSTHNNAIVEVSGSAMPLLHLVHVCQLFESTVEAVASCVPQKTVSSAVAGRSVCGGTVNNELCVRLFVKRVQY